jgi:two-component system, NtrC family, response regulator
VEQWKVLVVDDEIEVSTFFKYFLESKHCEVHLANSGKEVDRCLALNLPFHLAFVDLKLPDANGLELLAKIKRECPACEVIIMTGYSTIQSAVTAIQNGARDYLEKPFDDLDALEKVVDSIFESAKTDTETVPDDITLAAAHFGIYYSSTSPMKKLMSVAYKLAKKNINILIEGETGTGKELMSRFIHGTSLRAQFPFVGVNCGAIPDSLLESELFGHEKGAFTGALKTRKGFFELANGGSMFLDEIGEAPHTIQVKLLRAIETGEFMRIGSEATLVSDIRFIAATNRSLQEEVEKDRFRSDLLYRLEGVKLTLPPLRERVEDIPLLCAHYLEKKYGASRIDEEALAVLKQYDWPGNIRQLINLLNQTIAIHDCPVIRVEHLPAVLFHTKQPPSSPNKDREHWLDQEIDDFVKRFVSQISSIEEIQFQQVMDKLKKIETEVGRQIIRKGLVETAGNRKLLSMKLNMTNRVLRYFLNEKS